MIPYGRQDINAADVEAVVEVLNSDFLTQGPAVPRFEKTLAEYCGVSHAAAVTNATSALHLACLALDLGEGDILWTSPNSFVASANCALYCGAEVDFVDIDERTYNLCPEKLEAKLIKAEATGRLPKVVVPVHFAGQSCDMKSIYNLAQKYHFRIIEDASHAIGGEYSGEKIGSCKYSDITVFSFHPVKIITTGEGGAITTNCEQIFEKLVRLRSHGITTNRRMMRGRPEQEIWNYQQVDLGFNYRMTDIQAALGCSQLQRLDQLVAKRHTIAKKYDESLGTFPISLPGQNSESYSSYHLYPIRIPDMGNQYSQGLVYSRLRDSDILVNIHYIPIHRQPFYEALGFQEGDYPAAEKYHRETISLPIFPGLSNEKQLQVISCLDTIFRQ